MKSSQSIIFQPSYKLESAKDGAGTSSVSGLKARVPKLGLLLPRDNLTLILLKHEDFFDDVTSFYVIHNFMRIQEGHIYLFLERSCLSCLSNWWQGSNHDLNENCF